MEDTNTNNQAVDQSQTNQQSAPPVVTETVEQKYQRLYNEQQAAAPPVDNTPQIVAAMEQMANELAALKANVPPPPPPAPLNETAWVDKIREGDYKGAQAALAAQVRREMAADLEAVQRKAYNDALSATQVNIEIEKHLSSVRATNPDIVQFERYLEPIVANRVQQAKDAGRIKSTSDFLREYRTALDFEVGELRKLGLQFRAAGKDEATSRNREVLTSSPLQPQQLQLQQGAGDQATEVEDTQGYFARRRADEMHRRRLQG